MDSTDTSNNLEVDSEQTRVLRPKAPVDIEKQCGVALPSGDQCARSLTCKRHGWSAKRAVPGRSAPFDQLLADRQREN
jgi:SAGA-associated factor 73